MARPARTRKVAGKAAVKAKASKVKKPRRARTHALAYGDDGCLELAPPPRRR